MKRKRKWDKKLAKGQVEEKQRKVHQRSDQVQEYEQVFANEAASYSSELSVCLAPWTRALHLLLAWNSHVVRVAVAVALQLHPAHHVLTPCIECCRSWLPWMLTVRQLRRRLWTSEYCALCACFGRSSSFLEYQVTVTSLFLFLHSSLCSSLLSVLTCNPLLVHFTYPRKIRELKSTSIQRQN